MSDTIKIPIRDANNVDTMTDVPCVGRFGPICVVYQNTGSGRWYSLTHIATGRRFGPLFGDGILALECCEAMVAHFPSEFWIPPENGIDLKRKHDALSFAEPYWLQDAATILDDDDGYEGGYEDEE